MVTRGAHCPTCLCWLELPIQANVLSLMLRQFTWIGYEQCGCPERESAGVECML